MRLKPRTTLVVAYALLVGSGQAAYPPATPDDDRAALALLAPPANAATEDGTYGDAAFARAHRHRRWAARGVPCPNPLSLDNFRTCETPGDVFFRRNYVFTPSHVSAPQVFDQPPQRPEPVFPPVTAFFYNPFP